MSEATSVNMREVTENEFKFVMGQESDSSEDEVEREDDVAAAVAALKRSLQKASGERGLTADEKAIAALIAEDGATAAATAGPAAPDNDQALDLDDDNIDWSDDEAPPDAAVARPPSPSETCATRVVANIWGILRWRGSAPSETR